MNYREAVLECARRRTNFEFPNGSLEHAAAITEAMLLTAQNSYKLYSGSFDPSFYGRPELTNALSDFLTRDRYASVKVLVQDGNVSSNFSTHPWVLAAEKAGASIEIKKAVGNYADNETPHFSVVDETGYRFEFDKEVKARANFYDPETVKKLNTTFDAAFNLGV